MFNAAIVFGWVLLAGGLAVASDPCGNLREISDFVSAVTPGAVSRQARLNIRPAWVDLLYSLLYIPLYRKLLYKAKNA